MRPQLQKLVKKLISDETTRARFTSDPNGVIKEFGLTRTEKDALLKTQSRLGIVTSNSSSLEAAIDPQTDWA